MSDLPQDPRVLLAQGRLKLALKVQALADTEGWGEFVKTCQSLRNNAYLMLATQDLTPRQLGYYQGFMAVLAIVGKSKKRAASEVAQLERELSRYADGNAIETVLRDNGMTEQEEQDLLEAAGWRAPATNEVDHDR